MSGLSTCFLHMHCDLNPPQSTANPDGGSFVRAVLTPASLCLEVCFRLKNNDTEAGFGAMGREGGEGIQ